MGRKEESSCTYVSPPESVHVESNLVRSACLKRAIRVGRCAVGEEEACVRINRERVREPFIRSRFLEIRSFL